MKNPCEKCLILPVCKPKLITGCKLLDGYFSYLIVTKKIERIERGEEATLSFTIMDDIWREIWKDVGEHLPNLIGRPY